MSWTPSQDPECNVLDRPDLIQTVIVPRAHDVGGFDVRRALPSAERRMVGPFIFFDQMGPGEFLTGQGLDVRPHPHIGLSTVTYLLEGNILHRDSLGTEQLIRPGEMNLMTAGRGIAHSERSDSASRIRGGRLFGLQSWTALPHDKEETTPDFAHYPDRLLPMAESDGVSIRVITGEFAGLRSPVATAWEQVYVDIGMNKGATLEIPAAYEERALYPLTGRLQVGDTVYDAQQLLILAPGKAMTIKAHGAVRVMLFGGATMDGPRHVSWNFVSSSKDRIEQAKADWQAGRFPAVPNDHDWIPLPDRRAGPTPIDHGGAAG